MPTSSTPSTTPSARPSRSTSPGCLDCQAEVASLREATALMADDAALTPPPSLRDSVLSGIPRSVRCRPRPAGRARRDRTSRPTRLPRWSRCAAAVASGWPRWPRPLPSWPSSGRRGVPALAGRPSTTQMSAADQVLAASDAKHVSIDFDDGSSATVFRSAERGQGRARHRRHGRPAARARPSSCGCRTTPGRWLPAGLMTKPGDNKVLLKGDAAEGHRCRHHRRARRRVRRSPRASRSRCSTWARPRHEPRRQPRPRRRRRQRGRRADGRARARPARPT